MLEIPGYELVPGTTMLYKGIRDIEINAEKLRAIVLICKFLEPLRSDVVNLISHTAKRIVEAGEVAEEGLEAVISHFPDDLKYALANSDKDALQMVDDHCDMLDKPREIIYLRKGIVNPRELSSDISRELSDHDLFDNLVTNGSSIGYDLCVVNITITKNSLPAWNDMQVLLKHKTFGSYTLGIEGNLEEAEKLIRTMYSILNKDRIKQIRDSYQHVLRTRAIITSGEIIDYLTGVTNEAIAQDEEDIMQSAKYTLPGTLAKPN